MTERLHAHIPFFFFEGLIQCLVFKIFVLLHKTRGLHNFEGIGRSNEHLHEQGIRIEGNRGKELSKPCLVNGGVCLLPSLGGLILPARCLIVLSE